MRVDRWLPRFIPRNEIAGICERFREKHCEGMRFPLDIELVVEKQLNLHIIPISGIRSLIGIDAFLRSDFTGIVVDNQEYMDDRYENRLRFSIAHEVGHFTLHRTEYRQLGIRTAEDYIETIERMSEKAYTAIEWQANQFAGNVLVPRDELDVALQEAKRQLERESIASKLRDDPSQLLAILTPRVARRFGVSERVIERRVGDEQLWEV